MRIRSQLILAAFLLAVVPLAAIVGWSYHSSRTALENAYRGEVARATRQMDRRLATIRHELEGRLATVSALPLDQAADTTAATREVAVAPIVAAMGDFADLVEAVEFAPVPPPPSEEASQPGVGNAVDTTATSSAGDAITPPTPASKGDHPRFRGAPRKWVINIPPHVEARRLGPSPEQLAHIQAIARHARTLQRSDLTQDERRAAEEELERTRGALDKLIRVDLAAVEKLHETLRKKTEEKQLSGEDALAAARNDVVADSGATLAVPPAPPVPAVAGVGIGPAGVETGQPSDHGDALVMTATDVRTPEREAKRLEAAMVAPRPAPSAQAAGKTDAAHEGGEPPRTAAAPKGAPVATATTGRKRSLILGREFNAKVTKEGALVGEVTARISEQEVLRRVLSTPAEDDDIPFAVDREGNVYTRDPASRRTLEQLGITKKIRAGGLPNDVNGWIVTASTDKQSGLRVGVARPVGANLEELRNAAAQNFSLGLALIGFALVGIVPLANHLTRDVALVTRGAERIAQGDLMTRLPVRSKNEFGQLSLAFNRMAEDLSVQQQQLVEQERLRQERELQQRLLEAEYERKTVELEDARRFQLSLLPKQVPEHQNYEVAVYTRTATEVGGDYYDFQIGDDGVMVVAVGDATGHGAKAGTMVTVVKTLFTAYAASRPPHDFLCDAAEKIKRMELGRMSMSLTLARFTRDGVTLASAGMPPVFVYRAESRRVEEVSQQATPLGTIATAYDDVSISLAAGDTILFMTDGLPELLDDEGQQFGYQAAASAFAEAATAANVAAVIAALTDAAQRWHGDQPPNDDVTFVAVRVR